MIQIAALTIAFISGLCVGFVVFIALGYLFVKKGTKLGNNIGKNLI